MRDDRSARQKLSFEGKNCHPLILNDGPRHSIVSCPRTGFRWPNDDVTPMVAAKLCGCFVRPTLDSEAVFPEDLNWNGGDLESGVEPTQSNTGCS